GDPSMRKTNRRGPGPSQEDWDILNEKLQLANDGDSDAIEWLRRFLDRNPQVWQQLGDLARSAERAWILLISDGNALVAESIQRQLASVRIELIGDTPTVIERLLGDTILATWLEVRHLEAESASPHAGGGSRTQLALLLKRLE